ncbi:M50 family metallopeptidase [Virgibacillus sp. Bac330]|uniref:M50 family metallopeptidase n=1 Tax=Virgibacillus sp. Bac330 TaxID=2419841 RepID=UPI000EF4CDDA|nr:M50 family metallopeptidase [Virgibacillus sp. Bac330]
MDVLLLFYLLVFVAPISIFFHEFGHAIVAWFFQAEKVDISIGAGTVKTLMHVGRFTISIAPLFFIGGLATSYRQPDYSRLEKIIITISGPLFSIFMAFIFWKIDVMTIAISFHLFVWFNLWVGLVNLIPLKWKGKKTDGHIIMQLLRNKNV